MAKLLENCGNRMYDSIIGNSGLPYMRVQPPETMACAERGICVVKIVSDSTCDLSKELIAKYNIDILPLYIVLGDQEYTDGEGVSPDEIYRWSDANNATPKTAACSIDRATELFRKYADQGEEIVCFAISESMSTTGNVMRMAAEEVGAADRIHVVNSANLSTGIGLLVIEAAIMAQAGKGAKEIVEHVEALKPQVRSSFVVDTLTFLHRGGRCSGLAAMLGGALKLHPRIAVEDGKMAPGKKYRGKMGVVIKHYAADMEEDLLKARKDRVFITHSGCAEADIQAIYDYLKGLNRFDEILITRAGGVISSHCGPGTLGVLFIAE